MFNLNAIRDMSLGKFEMFDKGVAFAGDFSANLSRIISGFFVMEKVTML